VELIVGTIRNTQSGQLCQLAECTVIGRAPTCDVRVLAPEASAEHAALRWIDQRWRVVDLSSRNGTWIAGHKLGPGEATELDEGSVLCFGSLAEAWLLVSASPPKPFIRGPGGDHIIDNGIAALPSTDEPTCELWQTADGGWVIEDDSGRRPAEDRDLFRIDGRRFRLYLPIHVPRTAAVTASLLSVDDTQLVIRHDGTEEYITVAFEPTGGRPVDLGARAHNAVLLELARVRLDDRTGGIVEAEQGWIHRDDLSTRLNLPVTHVNIMVHRLRRQLAESGVIDAAAVVERRARSGLLRLGVNTVKVERIK
jgi:hypothetical protein